METQMIIITRKCNQKYKPRNKNNFVQLEDTKIKTERVCSMQRTEQTTVLHHSSLGLHCHVCPDNTTR